MERRETTGGKRRGEISGEEEGEDLRKPIKKFEKLRIAPSGRRAGGRCGCNADRISYCLPPVININQLPRAP